VHFKHTSILYNLLLILHTTGINIQKFYVLHTQWICVFYMGLRANGYYFLVQHWPIGFRNRHGVCNFSLPPRSRWILDTWPLKYGTDRLSRNVSKELLLYTSFSQKNAGPEMECVYCAVETKSLATVQAIQSGICGGHTSICTSFWAGTSVFPCHYNSTNDPCSCIYHGRCINSATYIVIEQHPRNIRRRKCKMWRKSLHRTSLSGLRIVSEQSATLIR
jgi:hypothetical protein